MPYLNVKLSARRSPQLTRQVSALLQDAAVRLLGKRPDVTAIAVEHVPPEDWFVGGRSLAEQGKASFFLDIRITDETNTKAEKARFIAEVFAGLARLLGDLHEESYVHVEDVRAAAYGYGGKTQERRYQHGE